MSSVEDGVAANKIATEPRVPSDFESFAIATMVWLAVTLWLCFICRYHNPSFLQLRLITGFVVRVTWRVPLVEQELITLPEHLSSHWLLVRFVLLDL